ncbi:hypothetical protein [Acidithiobacillus sp.]|uniref:hypothetical protein n=1 Tax=Acidithiobacillus sp. TaxID=1872118 RepID=UPI003D034BB1
MTLDDLHLRRGAEHLCRLGPRALVGFLDALAEKIGGRPAAIHLLNEYRRMSPDMLRVTGGDRFPPRLRVVPKEAAR